MLDQHHKTVIEEKVKQDQVVNIFSLIVLPGQKAWECNPTTLECREVKKDYSWLTEKDGMPQAHHRAEAKEDLIYLAAINKKNALRQLKKLI